MLRRDQTLGQKQGRRLVLAAHWKAGEDHLRVGGFQTRFSRYIGLNSASVVVDETGEVVPDGTPHAVPLAAGRRHGTVDVAAGSHPRGTPKPRARWRHCHRRPHPGNRLACQASALRTIRGLSPLAGRALLAGVRVAFWFKHTLPRKQTPRRSAQPGAASADAAKPAPVWENRSWHQSHPA